MEEVKLRRLTCEDRKVLQKVSYKTFYEAFASENKEENIRSYLAQAFSDEQVSAELAETQSAFYFAQLRGEIVGYIKINVGSAQTDLKEDSGLELERIYVLHQYQGQQIGQQLLVQVIDMAKQQQKDYVWLGVWDRNHRAIKFYESNGFQIFSSHPFLMGAEMQTDYLMRRTL